jgi:hypothetical protein
MKRILNLLTIVSVGTICLSLTESVTMNVDYWKLSYNDQIIFSGHAPCPYTIITMDSKAFKYDDSLNYFYHPCSFNDKIDYLTKLYLVTPQKVKFLVSTKKSNGYGYGNFPTKTIKQIIDNCKCDTLKLEETSILSWKNKKGKNEKEAPYTRTLLNIKVEL